MTADSFPASSSLTTAFSLFGDRQKLFGHSLDSALNLLVSNVFRVTKSLKQRERVIIDARLQETYTNITKIGQLLKESTYTGSAKKSKS